MSLYRAIQLTNSVDISLDIRFEVPTRSKVGNIVIDDHVDLLNIDTSSDDVGSDEDFGFTVPKLVEDLVSLIRHFVSVERGDRVTFFSQPLGDSVGSVFSLDISCGLSRVWAAADLAEHDTLSDGHDIVQSGKSIVLLLFSITLQVKLLDSLDSDLFFLKEDLIGFGSEIVGEILDVVGESSRKENVLNPGGKHPTPSAYT
jgi:hypothetical protein